MTAVGFQDAARYAVKLFGYLLAVVVVATGAISIGYWLVRPEISPALGSGTAEKAPLIGGSALIVIGSVLLSIGWISAVYKLIADAVGAGGATGARAAASPAASGEREPAGVPTGTADPADEAAGHPGAGETGVAAAASERARAAQAEVDHRAGASTAAGATDSSAALGGEGTVGGDAGEGEEVAIGSQDGRETSPAPAERETSPEPPDRETSPQPPERETSPEPPDRETSPEHPERETNPDPPSDTGDAAERPEPSAEEIAFGSGGESAGGDADTADTESGDAAADAGPDEEAMFTSKSVASDEQAQGETPDPMWSDEGPGESGSETAGSGPEADDGDGDDGFEEPPIEEDVDEGVEPAGGADRDPLADDE